MGKLMITYKVFIFSISFRYLRGVVYFVIFFVINFGGKDRKESDRKKEKRKKIREKIRNTFFALGLLFILKSGK